jgi:hypothetical protein
MKRPETVISNNLTINGIVTGANIGVKSPIFFTTNRTVTINGDLFSVYDLNISKYTKKIALDGYNIRQFRVRHWPASADFELSNTYFAEIYLKRMIYSCQMEMDLVFFHYHHHLKTIFYEKKNRKSFLFRKDFNYITFCSRGVPPVKVYFIIEY